MTETIWLCEEHYQEECKKIGREIPILTIYNSFRTVCGVDGCGRTAEHLIDKPQPQKATS